jgi:hypothetical protein
MRKITELSAEAFESNTSFRSGNTVVSVSNETVELKLHGNVIARKDIVSGQLSIATCGWNTNTTRERLNGLSGVRVYQSKGILHLNGTPWNGKSIVLNK